MDDGYDDGFRSDQENGLSHSNTKAIPQRKTAVAIDDGALKGQVPRVTAAGRGKIAEKILQLAFDHGVRVREDGVLADMLTHIEIDSPIPSEAFMAVAEILSYVYRANGQPNPFDAVWDEDEP